MSGQDDQPKTFKDLYKNPEYTARIRGIYDTFESAIAAAKDWDEDQLCAAVEQYLTNPAGRGDVWGVSAGLLRTVLLSTKHRLPTAVVRVSEVLKNAGLLTSTTGKTYYGRDIIPLEQVTELLAAADPVTVIVVVGPYLDHEDPKVRAIAIEATIRHAAGSVKDRLPEWLVEETRPIVNAVRRGLRLALQDGSIDDADRSDLFDVVLEAIDNGPPEGRHQLIYTLFAIDTQRSVGIFSDIDRWVPDDPDFSTLNRELFSAGAVFERRRLLDVISIAENAADAADTDMAAEARSSVGSILKLLALHHDVKDEPLFQRYRKSKDFMLAGDAIDAFLVSRREPTVDEFAGSLYRRKEQNEPLSGEERKLVALFDCDGQINNGGLGSVDDRHKFTKAAASQTKPR